MLFSNFLIGLIVNFIGYIPFGNINLTVVQLTINRGLKDALYFIVSFSFVEFFFTYGAMYFADWLAAQKNLIYWLDWILIVVFLILGIIAWRSTHKQKEINYSHADSIKYGLILGLVNPMQIPFWMIGGTYLLTNNWVVSGGGALAIFSIGAAAGAFLCLFCFAKFSNYLQEKFSFSNKILNRSIAILFFSFAAYHLVKQGLLFVS